MELIRYPDTSKWDTISQRPTASYSDLEPLVTSVFNDVQTKGDQAVFSYTQKFDKVQLKNLIVSEADFKMAAKKIPLHLKEAIQLAKSNITAFHQAQKTPAVKVTTQVGVECWQEKRPIERVGLYIPGGSAPLFSTILMLAVPAVIAGCKEIVLCTPPNKEGKIPDVVLYTAQLCGLTQVFKVGGIQAIAAMTFGTETIPKVFKIFGPGNQYVTAAKQMATRNQVAIDLPAGPSELLVAADATANPRYIAADLLSQAEHGPDSQVVLVTTHAPLIFQVQVELKKQLEKLPRKKTAEKAIQNSKIILFKTDADAIDFINIYAPEHYIICVENNVLYIDGVINAGSVFIGNFTPESAGDYASGTNHTLPTNSYAKQYSGVNLDSFTKAITFQKISSEGLQNIGPSIELMAEAEGLEAHKNAVTLRLNDLKV